MNAPEPITLQDMQSSNLSSASACLASLGLMSQLRLSDEDAIAREFKNHNFKMLLGKDKKQQSPRSNSLKAGRSSQTWLTRQLLLR